MCFLFLVDFQISIIKKESHEYLANTIREKGEKLAHKRIRSHSRLLCNTKPLKDTEVSVAVLHKKIVVHV